MWGPPTSFDFFHYFQPSVIDYGYYQPIIVPFHNDYYPFPSPPRRNSIFNDSRILLRSPRFTNNIFERINSKFRGRSYSARPPISRENKQSFQMSYKIHNSFTLNEKRIIENALKFVANRLCKPEIVQNMYDICGRSGYFLASQVWERSQLENHRNYHGPYDLLRYQLMCLRVKGEKNEFPTIHIQPIYEETGVWGKGSIDCVACISHRSVFSTKGEFNVKLNQYHLGAFDNYGSDPIYWSGVIVHEMLHNLGHKHKEHDYSDRWQINVFKQCFLHNGNY